jgi:hypothetical protein
MRWFLAALFLVAGSALAGDLGPGATGSHVSGLNTDIDDVVETVYEAATYGAADRVLNQPNALFVSSSSVLDDSQGVTILGVNNDGDRVSVVIPTLNGQAPVSLGALNFVNFAILDVPAVGRVYIHSDFNTPDGVPADPLNELRAVIEPGELEARQAAFKVVNGETAFLTQACTSTLQDGGNTDPTSVEVVKRGTSGGEVTLDTFVLKDAPDTICRSYNPPLEASPGQVLEITMVTAAGANMVAAASMNVLLLEDGTPLPPAYGGSGGGGNGKNF